MRRPTREDTATPGHDSFLDIVANIVGILIILVIVAGLRARNATVEAASSDRGILAEIKVLRQEQSTAESMRRDILGAAARIQDLTRERMVRQLERDFVATAVAARQHEIESRRSRLDAESQAAYDLRLQLSEAKWQLEELRDQRAAVGSAEAAPIRIASYPTPLSKTVDGREAHFQLRAGRVVFIPLDDLLDSFKREARENAYKLLNRRELTDTVGPEGGFRLRYTLERQEVTEETARGTVRTGSFARLSRWTLTADSSQLGEPVEAALAEGSRFRQALSQFDAKRATVTIWTYPDSFTEFRQLKKELYNLGFAAAGRPLPHGVPIGGSPQGSKSAAE